MVLAAVIVLSVEVGMCCTSDSLLMHVALHGEVTSYPCNHVA